MTHLIEYGDNLMVFHGLLGIWHYMEKLRESVTDLDRRVTKAQENTSAIKTLMKKWEDEPLFTRYDDGRAEALFNSSDIAERKGKRNKEMKSAGEQISSLIAENLKHFRYKHAITAAELPVQWIIVGLTRRRIFGRTTWSILMTW